MITKNVYVIYPPGYHGSYVKWALESADCDVAVDFVKNPTNLKTGSTFGGVGTSHLHSRIPTHQGLIEHQIWINLNRPQNANVYLINSVNSANFQGDGDANANGWLTGAIAQLLCQDRSGIIIYLHDNDDPDIRAYGRINCSTKWPIFFEAHAAMTGREIHPTFDSSACSQDRLFRNYLVERDKPSGLGLISMASLNRRLANRQAWYDIRHKHQPHEVNEESYLVDIDTTDRIFDIRCDTVPTLDFYEIIENLLIKSNISTQFDITNLRNAHASYIAAQPNLCWFSEVAQWRNTGRLSSYLCSHSAIHAELIRLMRIERPKALPENWQNLDIQHINDLYQNCIDQD